MNVRVEITLDSSPAKKHRDQMHLSAKALTDDVDSIVISEEDNIIIAEFTVPKARQIDVVDEIGDEFSDYMEDYSDSSISFSARRRKRK